MDHRIRPGITGRLIASIVILSALTLPAWSAPVKLKVGLMPAVDAAPMLLAAERGFFAAEGVDVELVVFTNANERQVALQTGAVDGTITDLVAFVYNVQGGFDLRIASSTDGSFPFLVRKDYVESTRVRVAMMEVSVSNYLADAWLRPRYELEKIFITEIPARLEVIKAGKVDMACLPEPIASMGVLSGLEKREFSNTDDYYPDILVFTAAAAAKKLDAIRRFNRAVDRAVAELVAEPSLARALLVEKLKLDPRVKDMMTLPTWHPTRLPGAEYLAKVSAWIADLQGKPVTLDWSRYLLRAALP
ncbi:MAG TPA: MetQ/NlpA family ABC transporter substrate-binding protein [Spirochaetales bacterium]|nr:MetQ/NlpA family ABC transporter substrate-binding protein [Spirochaetales bacterium]